MLNEYHCQFLKFLIDKKVRFLVIGGQARYVLNGVETFDLDIWVDISEPNKQNFEQAISCWAEKYPSHTTQNITSPLPLRICVQIHLPEHDACFLSESDEIKPIKSQDGIDILTSIPDADFDSCMAESIPYEFQGIELRIMNIPNGNSKQEEQ